MSVEIYDIATNSWGYGNPVVTKAAAPSGGLAGGKAMVQGGVDNVTYYNTVQVSRGAVRRADTYADAHPELHSPIRDKSDRRQYRARRGACCRQPVR